MQPTNAVTITSLNSLLDVSLDDLKDLPAFEIPPVGHYKLAVTMEGKVVNEVPSIEAKFKVLETVELSNSNDTPAAAGAEFSMLFMLNNEYGQGNLKSFVSPIAQGLGLSGALGGIIDSIKDVQIYATVKHRQDKKDKDRVYANVVNVTVA